jgi:hypothetical protein
VDVLKSCAKLSPVFNKRSKLVKIIKNGLLKQGFMGFDF